MMKHIAAFTIFSVLSVCLLSGQAQQAPSGAEVPKKKSSQENSGVQQLMQRKRGPGRGFLATPTPEPSTLLLLGIGTLGVISSGWRWALRMP
jgi:hypothetical protein